MSLKFQPLITLIVLILTLNTASAQFLFSSPENNFAAISDFIEQTNQTIYISMYEFTSPQIAGFLEGKNATIIVEGGPPGGLEEISKKILCKLSEKHNVYLYKGDLRFLHAKYMITGDSVLVSSENFAESKNRGWGVWVSDSNIANKLLEVFQEELEDSVPYKCNLENYSLSPSAYSKSFSTTTDYVKVQIENLDLVTAPENAVEKITQLIRSANESIYIEQFYIRNWEEKKNPFLEESIEKARQGLEVRVLLDSVWYNKEENGKIVDYVNSIAEKENLNLEARLIDLGNLDKLHNKGMLIDEKIALVSSINWNENSPTNNREVGLIVEGSVDYFVDLFKRDFQGEKEYVAVSYFYLVLSIVAVGGFLYIFRNKI